MATKTCARLEGGAVLELLHTDKDVTELFHPSLRWVDVTGSSVQVGWVQSGATFAPPPQPEATPAASQPTLAQLQAELAQLSAQVAALAKTPGG
ncbi:MAG TPA: hypothetical protein VHS58_18685 [Acetobacteraceae bacterium]|jgi:hypothetical protein|nr:hypothetical protein [Acetobacteraceae bacterium]